MGRRLFLPVTDRLLGVPQGKPSAEDMRKRLGGRQKGSPENLTADVAGTTVRASIGSFVETRGGPGAPRVGVLLSVNEGIADIYFEKGMVKRTPMDRVVPLERFEGTEEASPSSQSEELRMTGESLRIFDKLAEGDQVQVEEGDGSLRGLLLEKCKYGALVEVDGSRVLGVGFRKIWPAPTATKN